MMKTEIRYLLCGMFAGLVLGTVIATVIQHRRRGVRPMANVTATSRRNSTAKTAQDGVVSAIRPQARADADGIITQLDEAVAIQIIPSSSLNFSVPFVRALRELKAAGEPQDVIVNLAVAEFNRQWRDQMKIINQKRRSGDIDHEESQEFFSGRENAIGKTIAELLGQDSFVYWDKQRLLRKGSATGYKLTDAESDQLYRVEKEHEDRKLELNAAFNAGEIDPLDFEEQNKKVEEPYQQLRAKFLTEDRRVREPVEAVNLRTQIREQTRQLNLSPQEVDALADVAFKNLQASQEMGTSDTNLASRVDKEEAAEIATEREWKRILGPERFADFKKANDYRYQQMKQYQKLWRLSDTDVNYLYETFGNHDKAIEEHNAQSPPVPEGEDARKETTATQIDEFAKAQRQQLEAELQRFLGEERFRRFKAAGLAPQTE